jgi:CRP/FNR family transcriptional regulator
MSSDLDTLGLVPLFRDLTPSQRSDIVSRFREDTFNQDAYIFYENDRAARLWIVRDGQVKIVKYGEGGREAVIEVISPGEVFGGAAMLMPQHPATLSLSTDQYKLMLQEQPAVAVRVIESLGHRLLSVIGTRMMASERVERRIAHILLKLASKSGVESEAGWQISISLSRQDIADLSDTTIETAIRVMSKFRKAGLVKTRRGGYVVILDPGQLREISGE